MKEKDRDIDDLFRSKLQHFEAETNPEDWDIIASRLPKPAAIPLRKRWPYWAAAVISLLLVMGGGVYLSRHNNVDTSIAKQIEKETQSIESQIKENKQEISTTIPATPLEEPPIVLATAKQIIQPSIDLDSQIENDIYTNIIQKEDDKPTVPVDIEKSNSIKEKIYLPDNHPVIEEVLPKKKVKETTSSRKWGFGMGTGGLTEGSGNVVNTYVLRSSSLSEDEKLLSMNALSDEAQGKEPKTNIKHKTPVSFGLSVSRQLNNRFSLQTGITYSFLTSDWETQASTYNKEIRQRLHFVGIPLSISYRIADWNRFRFYASAGAQAEINVAGKERTKSFFIDQQTSVNTVNVRMKEWQWSVNARAGISYPLLRFVSAYAEVGAAYYFDNGSDIETIYSDKAFNVSPQIGLRLNF